MGTYRFILAISVAISHTGFVVFGLNPGVIAVISFFLVSGYVMTALIHKNYFDRKKIVLFYLDRVFRIYPQYLFNIVIVLSIYFVFGLSSHYLSQPSLTGLIQNILIIPMGFYMTPWVGENFILIPPAWSLGIEFCFYILVPFIIINKLKKITFSLSYIIFLIAYMGILPTDYFGYRLIFGTIYIFICGSFLYENNNIIKNNPLKFILTFSVFLLILTFVNQHFLLPYNREVLIGLIFGIPALSLVVKLDKSYLDNFLGNLSYGIFLSHYSFVFIFEELGIHWNSGSTLLMLLFSILLSIIGFYYFEKPVIKFRKKLRIKYNGA